MEEYKSLFEYLGKAAGPTLGKIVFETAKHDKIVMQQREVSNPVYKGKVMTYPVSWLDSYFAKIKELNNNELSF